MGRFNAIFMTLCFSPADMTKSKILKLYILMFIFLANILHNYDLFNVLELSYDCLCLFVCLTSFVEKKKFLKNLEIC